MNALKRILPIAAAAILLQPIARAQAALVSAQPPTYPLAARAAGIEGAVKLIGTVNKDGKMQDLKVLSGPPELRQAAIDAVMKWAYKPYRHFGRLVDVETTVTVNFTMGPDKTAEQEKARAQLADATPQPQNAAPRQDESPRQ